MTQPLAAVLLVTAMFAHVVLTFVVLIHLGRARVVHVKARRVKISDIALGQKVWPEDATKLDNNYRSQFEIPVLFHIAALMALALGLADLVLALLGFAFVASRVLHTVIHTGSNVVRRRFNCFVAGVAMVGLMWIWLLAKVALGA